MQTITSAGTALHQLPMLHKSTVVKKCVADFISGGICPIILDYGAGRSADLALPHFSSMGAEYVAYDPYNIPESEYTLNRRYYDIILCSNVLNVINDIDEIRRTIRAIICHLPHGGKAFFKVYEGNGSCIGAETTKGYQQNKPTNYYYWKICEEVQHFTKTSVKKRGKIIIVSRN